METKPVANFRFRREAVMAKELLTNAEIPCVIQSGEGAGVGPIAGGSTILVRPEDLARARQVLEDDGILETEADDA
jgi:hypothetical protein